MHIVEETDLRFELKQSTIANAGTGCFAIADLKKGDHIEVIGVYVSATGLASKCTGYANRYKFMGSEKKNMHIVPMGFAGMINHTEDTALQNVELKHIPNLSKRSVHAGQVVYRFIRDIASGEELLGYYGDDKVKEVKWFATHAEYHKDKGGLWEQFLSLNLYNLGLLRVNSSDED